MGARGGSGIEIDVSLVPQRETGMTPYEIMLSESQERMLLVVERGREAEVERIFEKWDLHAVQIGRVTGDGLLRVTDRGRMVAEIPNRALADEAPVYHRPMAEPGYLAEARALDAAAVPPCARPNDALLTLLRSPAIASKRWVHTQYDTMVRTNTIVPTGLGAAAVRVKGSGRALALSVDGNGRYCYLDPFRGAALAVAEAARNVACAGARPIGATNCLNFGNPERPEIMWQFAQAVAGMAEACRRLDIPITGGNVSLYNETDGRAIHPTPVIGVVGVVEDERRILGRAFAGAGDVIVLLGDSRVTFGGSEYLKTIGGLVRGAPPELDLGLEHALQQLLAAAAADGLLRSAQDASDGGLAIALAECCFDTGGIGARVDFPLPVARGQDGGRGLALFGESASRAIVSVEPDLLDELLARARAVGVPADPIGETGGDRIVIDVGGSAAVDVELAAAERAWARAIGELVEG
jgi:phosphoribosylformylglycinamidine synthase